MQSCYQSGVKFVCYPLAAQQTTLNRWIGCQRVVYNGKVEEDAYFYAFKRSALSLTGLATPLDQQYAQFKSDLTPWLAEVPSQILRNGAVRWMTAKQRQLKGLAQAPVKKHARGRQTVLITRELFKIEPHDPDRRDGMHRVFLGTKSFHVGEIAFKAHRPYRQPKQIVIARDNGRWFVSFSYEMTSDMVLRTPEELAYELNNLGTDELEAVTNAYDRGVTNRLTDARSAFYRPDPVTEERAARKQMRTRRYQRKLARQVKGSNNAQKTRRTIAALQNYRARCAQDWAHKVSYQLVQGHTRIHVFEQLKIANMVRKATPKMEGKKYVRNGARAKSGLNKSILASGWGRIAHYTHYKAARRNQLVLLVKPHHSSNECSHCAHIHPDNRLSQSAFICTLCGHAQHADINAALVLRKRGIEALRAGIKSKPKKTVVIRRTKKDVDSEGAGCSGLSVERIPQSQGRHTSPVHSATKQKISVSDDGCSGL